MTAVKKHNEWQADRLGTIPLSGIRKVLEGMNNLRAQGIEVIDLATGHPNYDTPANIKEAAKNALDNGFVHYTSNYGIPQLTVAIADKLRLENNLEYDPAAEIMVTVGASEAIFIALTSFLNPGEEVLVPTPCYPIYLAAPKILGAKPVKVPLREDKNFSLVAHDVAERITKRTKMLVLATPHNPTGSIVEKRDLIEIARLAKKHNFLVLSDEVYEKFIYDGNQHVSVASLPDMKERTITINSFSKTYSMTGWRVGWVAAHKPLIDSLVRLHQYTVGCAASFSQVGAEEALLGQQRSLKAMIEEFERRRNLLVGIINEVPGLKCKPPTGAFYVFLNIKPLGMSSEEAVSYLLEEALIATVPGTAFGEDGEGYIRICYCNSYENIRVGLERMKKVLQIRSSSGT